MWTATTLLYKIYPFFLHKREHYVSGQRYTPELKGEAVKLISERRYSVTDMAEYLGISQHNIYKMWTPI